MPMSLLVLLCIINRLRLRLKAMQQVVDAQSDILARYQTVLNMSYHDHSTGQGEWISWVGL